MRIGLQIVIVQQQGVSSQHNNEYKVLDNNDSSIPLKNV